MALEGFFSREGDREISHSPHEANDNTTCMHAVDRISRSTVLVVMWRAVQRRAFTRQCRASFPHPSVAQARRGRKPVMATSRYVVCQRRTFVELHAMFLFPVYDISELLIALWSWKCCMIMIVVPQNKIIYVSGLLPNTTPSFYVWPVPTAMPAPR
jgi:hypothetical protein